MTLKEMIQRAVEELIAEKGTKDVYHPELGLVIRDGKATQALISFYKKYEKKKMRASMKSTQNNRENL